MLLNTNLAVCLRGLRGHACRYEPQYPVLKVLAQLHPAHFACPDLDGAYCFRSWKVQGPSKSRLTALLEALDPLIFLVPRGNLEARGRYWQLKIENKGLTMLGRTRVVRAQLVASLDPGPNTSG